MGPVATASIRCSSTPDDPSIAVINGLSELAQEHGRGLSDFLGRVDIIVHGTTVTTNAVLTGKHCA